MECTININIFINFIIIIHHYSPDSCYDQNIIHFSNKTESDNSWIREKIRVRTMECPLVHTKALYIENLAVFFRDHVVLKHINMLVERYVTEVCVCVCASRYLCA